MRIIGGTAKGKRIHIASDLTTRPLKDSVKESIFNILIHSNLMTYRIENSNVLDLFSGIGSFGLEAISRGANKVIFFEKHIPAIRILNKNIDILNFNEKSKVYQRDLYDVSAFKNVKDKYELVFIDPPFKDQNINLILKNLKKSKIINDKTLIILHREKLTKDNFSLILDVKREEVYGLSKIIFGKVIF